MSFRLWNFSILFVADEENKCPDNSVGNTYVSSCQKVMGQARSLLEVYSHLVFQNHLRLKLQTMLL